MKLSNVKGVLGKRQLDKGKIKPIRSAAFRLYPVIVMETERTAWVACIRSID